MKVTIKATAGKVSTLSAGSEVEQSSRKESLISTQPTYVFYRIYHIILQRLELAYDLANAVATTRSVVKPSQAHISPTRVSTSILFELVSVHIAKLRPNAYCVDRRQSLPTSESASGIFQAYITLLSGYLDGSCNTERYDDGCRQLLGVNSYPLSTLDRIVIQVVKQLQHLSNDVVFLNLFEMSEGSVSNMLFPEVDLGVQKLYGAAEPNCAERLPPGRQSRPTAPSLGIPRPIGDVSSRIAQNDAGSNTCLSSTDHTSNELFSFRVRLKHCVS